jgi:hypothetical protein
VSVESKRREVDFFMVRIKKGCISILLVVFSLAILVSCDYEIMPVDYEFGHPPRIVYIAGVDTELDFTDVTLISTARDGYRSEKTIDPINVGWPIINHSIDFTLPGVYEVELIVYYSHSQFYITLFVQVIDEDVFNDLSGRTE